MTTEERLATLEQKLAVLEARLAGEATKIVRANGFILEDENGEPRAVLAVVKDGPRLGLVDEKGEMIWEAPQ